MLVTRPTNPTIMPSGVVGRAVRERFAGAAAQRVVWGRARRHRHP